MKQAPALLAALCFLISTGFHSSSHASAWLGHGPDAPKLKSANAPGISVWQPLEVASKPMGAPGKSDEVAFTINKLKWQGGLVLTSRNKEFGGFSGLRLSEDGTSLQMLSDRAHWFKADVAYNDKGAITRLSNASIATMMRYNGEQLEGSAGDSEGLELLANGKAIVSFERYHRVDLYRLNEAGHYIFDQRLLHNRLVKGLTSNASLEAVARLKDGRVLTIAEGPISSADKGESDISLFSNDARPGWISKRENWQKGGDDWRTFAYQTAPEFSVTDIAQDPLTEDLFVLERAFSRSKGVRARITRVAHDTIMPGTLLQGEELAQLNMVQGIDNMEGLALRRTTDGRLMLYMVSDDNFSVTQRTVLLSWEVLEKGR